MKRVIALLMALALMVVSLGSVAAQTVPSQAPVDPQEGCNYYEETGHNLCGIFLSYWENNGGLPVFGFPITEAFEEMNLDTGGTYLVQYFERERMEHHPALAGSEYEVLLGRLGNEVLLMQGRNWLEFEKSDPSEDNYFAETGFAVPSMFLDYWTSHGLDFGEEGYSFRESLALFGYPISQAQMETNADGDTVLTQWFERARFEHHPDNPEGQQILLGRLGVEILAEEPPPEADFTVIAEGLDQPRHVSVGADGALYVAVAGSGGDECVVVGEDPETGEEFSICFGDSGSIVRIADGETETIASGLPSYLLGEDGVGVHDVAVTADGEIYAVTGLGADPAERDALGEIAEFFGLLIQIHDDGSWTEIADIAAYEAEANPEPAAVDSNPYSLIIDGENFIVADAGGNTLLQVTPEGEITTLAVFPPQMVLAPPFLGLPEGTEIPMEAVPTSVVKGPDGAYYVGELTGFPFAPDMARIWRVVPGEDPEVFATGFTNIGELSFDGAGNLYVLEIVAGGLLNASPEDPASAASAIIRIAPDGTQTTVATGGLIFSTGMAITADGSIYATNLTIFPGAGQVVLLDETAAGVPEPEPDFTVLVEGLDQPRHVSVGDDGALYVAVAGSGGDECAVVGADPESGEEFEFCFGNSGSIVRIVDGEAEEIVTGLPSFLAFEDGVGVHDVAVTESGEIYAVTGWGFEIDPAVRDEIGGLAEFMGLLVQIHEDGTWTEIADIAGYEVEANPDPRLVDSNPYSLIIDGENFIVADAGGNTLLQVTPEGEISTLAVFPPIMMLAPPFLELPEGTEIPADAVPTSVVKGPDGAYYVGQLTGFPFEVGAANVWRVVPGEEPEVFEAGFTNIGDLAFDAEGNLYVLEIVAGGFLNASPEDPASAASAITMIAEDGTQTVLATEGLIFSTGMAIDADGSIYATNLTIFPGAGQAVMLD